jgi:MFS family permease
VTSKPLPAAIRSLAHRDFRYYFCGHAISILGSWIQQVAMAWLVYRLTGSAVLLGITTFAALIPQLVIGPLAGAWIDKQDKRRWLIGVQFVLALQALLLAFLTMQNLVTPSLLVAMSLLLGLMNSFDAPLRQALIGRFVGSPADLPNALALNAMLFNTGRFIGPPVAGLLLALTSEAACFAINSLSFIALITALLMIKGGVDERATGSMAQVFREGVAYAWKTWEVRMLLTILVGLNVTASCYAVLLPIFAKDVFGGDATTLGWLWGAAGSGAFSSTLFLATRRSLPGLVGSVVFGVMLSAGALLAFAVASTLLQAMAAMALLGFGISVCNVGCNMLLQGVTPGPLRGRIMSFFASARFGFDAIGGLIAGVLAASLGAGRTLLVEGGLLLLFLLFLEARRVRLRERVVEAGHRVDSGPG